MQGTLDGPGSPQAGSPVQRLGAHSCRVRLPVDLASRIPERVDRRHRRSEHRIAQETTTTVTARSRCGHHGWLLDLQCLVGGEEPVELDPRVFGQIAQRLAEPRGISSPRLS